MANLDPIAELDTRELDRANALQGFIREACEQLPLDELADRLRA